MRFQLLLCPGKYSWAQSHFYSEVKSTLEVTAVIVYGFLHMAKVLPKRWSLYEAAPCLTGHVSLRGCFDS